MNNKRLGLIDYNKFGSKIKIIKYNHSEDVDIYFEEYDWVAKNVRYDYFKNKTIACPYEPRLYNVGYIGEGKYCYAKDKKCYAMWSKMLERCYSERYQNKKPTYKGCEVCEEWYNFQNFAKWYYENYYEIKDEEMHLDKDILCKGNKIYSPQTCIIVPERINSLFTNSHNVRGELPIGCTFDNDRIRVRCCTIDKRLTLGHFPLNRPFQAFTCYKNFKEKYVKEVADEYKDLIPIELYNAMYEWRVDIND